ncbi:MAG: UDP-N-acetylmuramoylalanine--D-glutamate ligase, partial [Desulfobulbaceae bacterium]|nr:UDP-N-acetylmuramoylalanine--D-glutamate ligase [Desulfobulbaceae bacterium]
ILNGDDPEIMGRPWLWPQSRLFFFGRELGGRDGATVAGTTVKVRGLGREECYDLAATPLAESPNRENGAAAILAARLLGCAESSIRQGLAGFAPLAHRMTLVAEIDGVRYIDDSKGTNIGAVGAALAGMEGPVILIGGGRDKGGDYGFLNEAIRQHVKALLLIGEAREKMAAAFTGLTAIEKLDSLEGAVRRARQLAQPGDTVLLSPGCASFDMFTSYAHRGEVFRQAVAGLAACDRN